MKCEHIAEVFTAVSEIFGARDLLRGAWPMQADPEAFRRLAARLEVAAGEMLYLDDDAAYVAGAARPDCRRNG